VNKTPGRLLLLFMLSFLITGCASGLVKKNPYKGSLSPDQLDEIAMLIEKTEQEPISARSDELRETLSLWLVRSPDISVRIYNTLELGDDYPYKQLFTTQAMLLSAKYIIRHPDMGKEHLAIQVQTLHGLLDMYELIVISEGASAKNPTLEGLLRKRTAGTLEDHVQAIVTAVGDS